MDVLLLVLGVLLLIAGFVGCVAPVLPGPPLSYAGLLLLHWSRFADYSNATLFILLGVVVLVTLMDYILPVYMTKRYGGSRSGTWGAVVGLVVGVLFFALPGVIIGPFLGALFGELLAGRTSRSALKSAFGSLVGFLLGTGAKLIVCGVIAFYFISACWQ